jgi:hypothetical protein
MHNLIESNAHVKEEEEKKKREENADVDVSDEYCNKHISMIK